MKNLDELRKIRDEVRKSMELRAGQHRAKVVVGMGSRSVVLGYPTALLPLPALLAAAAIGVMALIELVRREPLDLGHGADVE